MSVEALVISGIVDHGNPKPAYNRAITKNDFNLYPDEFEWVEQRFAKRKPINRRVFCERFPDFEYILPKREKLDDLIEELKSERAHEEVYALIESVSETLLPENAVSTAEHMREVLAEVLKVYSPHSDILLNDSKAHLETIKQHRLLAKAGQPFGMPTLIPSLDYHWDGIVPGRLIAILGRPGMGKSFLIAWFCWAAIKLGYNIGFFSPEMDEFEHRCRLHTLGSADPEIQKAVGLDKPFKNRDLMRGTGFNFKKYQEFTEYFENELPGRCWLFTKKFRSTPMTPQYVANRVEDLGLHGIIADPIGKLSTMRRRDNPVWEAYEKVYAIQDLAKEHNIFALATNWSFRQGGKTKNEKAPEMDDSFGSDALAQESAHLIGTYYDEEDGILELRCSKSRFGKRKVNITIEFSPNIGKWVEVNMDRDVLEWRMSLNGKALQNGSQEKLNNNKIKKAGTNGGSSIKKAKPSIR